MRRVLSRILALMLVVGTIALTLPTSLPVRASDPVTWAALGPVDKPITRLLTPTSGALFAATDHELFRSDDGGLSWTEIARPTQTAVFTVSPVDHQLLYAAGTDGVHRSHDGGETWTRVSEQAGGWKRLEVSPADPNVLYGDATTESRDTYGTNVAHERRVSRDAGVTWEVAATRAERYTSGSYPCGYTVANFQPHATDSARFMTIEGCSVRQDPHARMSYDAGRTSTLFPEVNMLNWSSKALIGGQGARPERWYVSLFRSNVVYTRIRHSKILRTDDDGASWTTMFEEDSGEPYDPARKPVDFVTALAYDAQRPDIVIAVFERYELERQTFREHQAAGFTVRMSRDAGATWTELGSQGLPPVGGLAVGIDGRHVYAGTHAGVYRLQLAE